MNYESNMLQGAIVEANVLLFKHFPTNSHLDQPRQIEHNSVQKNEKKTQFVSAMRKYSDMNRQSSA